MRGRHGHLPFPPAALIPYSPDGEETRHSQKTPAKPRNPRPQVQGTSARRAADRAGAGRTAQSRDQPRRCRHGLGHRPAAAAGQFLGPPRRRRGRRAPRARLDAREPANDVAPSAMHRNARPRRSPASQLRHLGHHPDARSRTGAAARPAHRGGRRRGAGAPAAQQDGGARRQGHRRRAGEPDPRRPPGIQGRRRPGARSGRRTARRARRNPKAACAS